MRPHLRLVAGLALATVPFCACAAGPAAKTPALAEVRTWGDLLAQKPIALPSTGGPAKPAPVCRVGIDLTYAKLYGAAVLYCLSDEDCPTATNNHLGPFRVEVENAAQEADRPSVEGDDGPAHKNHWFLYIKAIPLPEARDYTINLRIEKGNRSVTAAQPPVAVAKFSVTKKVTIALPCWSPWGYPTVDPKPGADPDTVPDVSNVCEYFAVPGWPCVPMGFDDLPDPKLPLPPLLPAKPEAGLHLSISGNRLALKSANKDLLNISYLDNVLVRWWINGKPFVPPGPEDFEMMDQGISGGVEFDDSYEYLIEFHPKYFPVKKGDTIGVQLLYCPGGYLHTRPAQFGGDAAVRAFGSDFFPQGPAASIAISRMSDRLEFTYTGDPAAISAVASKPAAGAH